MLRKIARMLLSGSLLFSFINCTAQKEYKVMAIGFYNCENFLDTLHDPNKKDVLTKPTGKEYLQKLHNIDTVLQALGKDITPDGAAVIGLDDIENENVLKDLTESFKLKGSHYKYEWFYSPDERGLSTALLYNPKYLGILNSEHLHIATEKLPGKRPTRDILHISGIMAGDTVHIFVNHWPSKYPSDDAGQPARKLAAAVVKRVTDSLLNVNPNTKIIVMGNFNENPKDEEVADVLEARTDKKNVELNGFYNPWADMYKKNAGTYSYQHDWYLPDQILVSGAYIENKNEKWKYYKSEMFHKDFLFYHSGYNEGLPHKSYTPAHMWDNGYSDHLPVLLYLIEKKNNDAQRTSSLGGK